jgi:hypothetical protein
LVLICLLALAGNIFSLVHGMQTGTQEKPSPGEQEKQAAAKADAEKKRAETKAAAEKQRAAAKALAQEKRTLAREKQALVREKQVAQREKRAAARAAAEMKRSLQQTIRRATQPEGTFRLLGSRFGIGRVVKGAPYSATAITEHTQTLSDGNQIIQKNEANYYRDSEGRTRIDQRLKTIGKWTASGEPSQVIMIFDPVSGNHYSLDPRTHTALRDVRVPQKGPIGRKEIIRPKGIDGPKSIVGPKGIDGPKGTTGPSGISGPKEPPRPSIPKTNEHDKQITKEDSERRKKESLGTRVIEGVSAEGRRSTVTIPAGEIGNVAPIQIIDEIWYSTELDVPVMTSHHDPRSGDTVYRLTKINRSEPARSLFEVPSDYQIVEKRASKPAIVPVPPKVPGPANKPAEKF